jgi:SAM-dependent methyltransferase/3-polyprenyl-4-hydroxybenzoate decarboxylase
MMQAVTRPATEEPKLRRSAVVRIYEVGERMVVLGRDGRGHELVGDSAAFAREVLAFMEQPRDAVEIAEHIVALTGAPLPDLAVLDELLALLLGTQTIERVEPTSTRARSHAPGARIVLAVTGAVASMHAPALVQLLLERRYHVRVVATTEALRFVRAESLEALTHHPVVAELWPVGDALHVPHIELAQWADAVVVCPASATTLARLATGDHSSIVSATALATRAPVMVVPSMNAAMYGSPAVQRNLAQLAADGMHVVHPAAAIELADPPHARSAVLGGAPPWAAVVQLVETMLRSRPHGPRDAHDWDAVYRSDASELPWHSELVDDDILAALQRVAPASAAVLDVGCGLGSLAIACARVGHRVVATDVSTIALELARTRAGALPIVWLHDDVTDSHLHSAFDVAVDRGCLHVLSPEGATRWAATMVRSVRPGGAVVLKVFDEASAPARNTIAYDATRLSGLLGDAFAIESEQPSTLAGPDEGASARLFVLRRSAQS